MKLPRKSAALLSNQSPVHRILQSMDELLYAQRPTVCVHCLQTIHGMGHPRSWQGKFLTSSSHAGAKALVICGFFGTTEVVP
jgi:hypothetical protein